MLELKGKVKCIYLTYSIWKTHLKQVGMHLTFSQNSKQGCYSILISKQTKVNQENGTFVFQTINTV